MSKDQYHGETIGRLLAAATEVFADLGYRAASLREICRRGNANIAAVNYYFHDKERLYTAVLEQAVSAAGEGLAQIAPEQAFPPQEKLWHFIQHLLRSMLGADRPLQLLRLIAHEMVEPTPALDLAVEKAARRLAKGRAFYTSLGHREDIWTNPFFQAIVMGGFAWVLGNADHDVAPNINQVTPNANQLNA